MDIFLLFPIHLFSNIDQLKDKHVYLIEDPRFFTDFNYHKLKLAYHRATMKSYYDYLKDNKIKVQYIEFTDKIYNKIKNNTVSTYDLGDDVLLKKIKKIIPKLTLVNSLNFLVNKELINNNLSEFYSKEKYNFQNFYKWQRKRLNILLTKSGTPVGGQWSFDKDNRKPLPTNVEIPKVLKLNENSYITEAKKYIEKHFENNYGSLENFIYPIDHEDSKKWLKNFIKNKFEKFGKYEDAETMRDPFLFHSVISPMMNIGLITDTEVLAIVMPYHDTISIASFEGFIRQIIGWRNYLYSIYLIEGSKFKKNNFMNHTNKINKKIMWSGDTGILPIDNVIKKIGEYGYAHHIERLMYLGNYMLICMIRPKDVYELFMEWTIDAYEWVMVPNVFGMSQFCDGGKIMTRPYFSSSNYILKMSDYKKGEWCSIYDSIYYNFINKHETYLAKNYATSRQVMFWRKKKDEDKKELIKIANQHIKLITK